jgi:hypothetical protein
VAATKKKATRKKASRKKATRAKASRKKAGRPRGAAGKRAVKRRGASLANMTTDALASELARRERRLPALKRQHAELLGKLEAIEAEIAGIGGSGSAGAARGRGRASGRRASTGGKRPRNTMNLEDFLADTLAGKTMSVTEVTAAVQAKGYKTTAANFRTIVNATLLKSKKIRKVARGQYTAK